MDDIKELKIIINLVKFSLHMVVVYALFYPCGI